MEMLFFVLFRPASERERYSLPDCCGNITDPLKFLSNPGAYFEGLLRLPHPAPAPPPEVKIFCTKIECEKYAKF